MNSKRRIASVLLLFLCAAAPMTQPAPAMQPTAAELAVARPLLAEADKQAAALGDRLSNSSVSNNVWLEAHIRAGDWASAKSIIEASRASRDELFYAACRQAATVGDVGLAQQIVDHQLLDAILKEHGLAAIAAAKARQGDLAAAKAAFETLQTASDPMEKLILLHAIASAQLKSGDRAAAKATCQEMVRISDADTALSIRPDMDAIVSLMAEAGEVDAARKLIANDSAETRGIDTCSIAEGQALAGDFDGFKATISSLPAHSGDQALACQLTGADLARRGDIATAQRVLALCTDGMVADVVRAEIAVAQVRAGDIPAALATAAKLTGDRSEQLRAYAVICGARSLAGDSTGAAQTLALARQSANNMVHDRWEQPGVRLAYVQAASGDTASAIKAIRDATTDPAKLFDYYSTAADMELSPP